MTEQEWMDGIDPQEMLDFMDGKTSQRKIELYTSGCYRTVWHLLPDERSRRLTDVRDRFFDGLATEAELDEAIMAAEAVPHQVRLDAWDSISSRTQVQILHDLFGNPFHPVAFDSSWCTPQAVSLAQQMYDSPNFDRLPLLADALEEAGCRDADFLAHLRGPGPHVRGCWVVDLVLGKE